MYDAFRVRWGLFSLLVVVGVAAGIAGGYGATTREPTLYRAQTSVVVQQGDQPLAGGASSAGLVATVGQLADKTIVAQNVIKNLALTETPTTFLDRLHVESDNSAVIVLSVDDADPDTATRTVQEVATVLGQLVLADFGQAGTSAPRLSVFDPAHALSGKVSPHLRRDVGWGGLLGLLVGLLAGNLLAVRRRPREWLPAPLPAWGALERPVVEVPRLSPPQSLAAAIAAVRADAPVSLAAAPAPTAAEPEPEPEPAPDPEPEPEPEVVPAEEPAPAPAPEPVVWPPPTSEAPAPVTPPPAAPAAADGGGWLPVLGDLSSESGYAQIVDALIVRSAEAPFQTVLVAGDPDGAIAARIAHVLAERGELTIWLRAHDADAEELDRLAARCSFVLVASPGLDATLAATVDAVIVLADGRPPVELGELRRQPGVNVIGTVQAPSTGVS